jgi:hypothetical protein
LCFKQIKQTKLKVKDLEDDRESEDVKIAYFHDKNIFNITYKPLLTNVQRVTLYNMLGQSITIWEIDNSVLQNIELPIKSLSSGIYVMQLQTSNGPINRKIIVP